MSTLTAQKARDVVRAALHEVAPDVDIDGLPAGADLREDLELDSLDFLRFVELVSDRTGVRIDEDDYAALSTLDSAAPEAVIDWTNGAVGGSLVLLIAGAVLVTASAVGLRLRQIRPGQPPTGGPR
jgi:acyl carrier protein